MAYIGNKPADVGLITSSDTATGDGSTTSFTITSNNEEIVVI